MEGLNIELESFNNACNSFLNGKYILAENKISAIMQTIKSNVKIKDIISSCLENYNFASNFEECVGENNQITLQNDAKSIIAFCFSLLYNIDNKSIKFYDFLNEYYGYNDLSGIECYKSFAMSIILPFNEAIYSVYERTHVLVDTPDYQNNIYNKIKKICQINLTNINSYNLKDIYLEELEILLNSMINACIKNDREVVYAILIAFDYFSAQHKKTKIIYEQLKECFD